MAGCSYIKFLGKLFVASQWRPRGDDYTKPNVSGHPAFIVFLIIFVDILKLTL